MRCRVSLRYLPTTFLLLLLLSGLSLQCGPGRGSGRRRRPRKLTPFVFKQHVPNVSENTLGASGLSEGPIKRNSPKFKDLVKNTNPEIEFRDEEGTGADNMMSQRCRDKLDRLAISVMNQWGKGVKLRVTEAWDEDNHHAQDSLHYEGRAVDITTSDRDKSKYGMLARLAVEAGFDWVYYESRGHIHCSVKSDSSVATKIGGCFPGSGTVVVEGGRPVPMSTLAIGDRVLSVDARGHLVYSEVMTFMDRNENEVAEFRVITTEDGASVTLTPKHLTYVTESNVTAPGGSDVISSWRTEFAEDVAPGQFLLKVTDGQDDLDPSLAPSPPRASRVVSTRTLTLRGVYAPLTTTGSIVVDGHVVSCYAFINSVRVAHLAFAPMRLLHEWSPGLSALLFSTGGGSTAADSSLSSSSGTTPPPTGLHWYARLLYDVGRVLLSRSVLHVP